MRILNSGRAEARANRATDLKLNMIQGGGTKFRTDVDLKLDVGRRKSNIYIYIFMTVLIQPWSLSVASQERSSKSKGLEEAYGAAQGSAY